MSLRILFIIVITSMPLLSYASDFILGVGTHIYGQNPTKNIEMLNQIGANSYRDDLPWAHVEAYKNSYVIPSVLEEYLALSQKQSINSLLVLDYGNKYYDSGSKPLTQEVKFAFTKYASFSTKRLAEKVNLFEIWNEWDHSKEPKSAESYFELVKTVAPAVKAANKDSIILAGAATAEGMRTGWVERLVKLGALKYVDGISIHPYVHCDRDKSPESWLKFVAETSARLQNANGGKNVPIYITEMGWPSHNGACGSSPELVAQYLARAMLLVRTLSEVKGIWWYDLKNDGKKIEEREHNFGLLNYDYSPKPAFAAFRDVSKYVINSKTVERLKSPSGIVALNITEKTGKKSFALWSETNKVINAKISIVREGATEPTILKIGTGRSNPIIAKTSTINLPLDGMPQIITGIQLLQIDKTD